MSQGLRLWAVSLSKSFIAFLYRVSRIAPVNLLIFLLEDHCKNSFLEVNWAEKYLFERFGVLGLVLEAINIFL